MTAKRRGRPRKLRGNVVRITLDVNTAQNRWLKAQDGTRQDVIRRLIDAGRGVGREPESHLRAARRRGGAKDPRIRGKGARK